MTKTALGGLADEPLDPQFNEAIRKATAGFALPELARLQATIDATVFKSLPGAELTRILQAAAMSIPTDQLSKALAVTMSVPKVDLHPWLGDAVSIPMADIKRTLADAVSIPMADLQRAVSATASAPLKQLNASLADIVTVPLRDIQQSFGAAFSANIPFAEIQGTLNSAIPPFAPIAGMLEDVNFHSFLADSLPKLDLSELIGFSRLAEGLAPTIDIAGIDGLARQIESILPAISANRISDLIGSDLVGWVASVELETSRLIVGEDDDQASLEDHKSRLSNHLEAVADWLYGIALRLRAGLDRLGDGVDVFNSEMERYQKLVINLLALYAAIKIIRGSL